MPHARLNDPQPNDQPHNRATPQIQYGTQLRGPHDDADKDRWVGPAWSGRCARPAQDESQPPPAAVEGGLADAKVQHAPRGCVARVLRRSRALCVPVLVF